MVLSLFLLSFFYVVFLLDILDRVKPDRFDSTQEIQWLKDKKSKIYVYPKLIRLTNKLKEFRGWLLEWDTWAYRLFGFPGLDFIIQSITSILD